MLVLLGLTHDTLRSRTPIAQLLEHALHGPVCHVQLNVLQGSSASGRVCSPHSCVASDALVRQERELGLKQHVRRCHVPPPQGREQGPNSLASQ
jgi:hypothetical protein